MSDPKGKLIARRLPTSRPLGTVFAACTPRPPRYPKENSTPICHRAFPQSKPFQPSRAPFPPVVFCRTPLSALRMNANTRPLSNRSLQRHSEKQREETREAAPKDQGNAGGGVNEGSSRRKEEKRKQRGVKTGMQGENGPESRGEGVTLLTIRVYECTNSSSFGLTNDPSTPLTSLPTGSVVRQNTALTTTDDSMR
ncbi:unnamed protein product [Lota lota]